MRQLSYLGGMMLGLALVLAACGGATVDPAETAAGTQPSPIVEVVVTDPPPAAPETVEAEQATTEIPSVDEEMMSTEAAAVDPEPSPAQVTGAAEAESAPAAAGSEEVTATEEAEIKELAPTEEVATALPGPTEEQQQLLDSLAVIGTPPELHNEVWLNSEPLKLAELRGQVVIVEFWTYG